MKLAGPAPHLLFSLESPAALSLCAELGCRVRLLTPTRVSLKLAPDVPHPTAAPLCRPLPDNPDCRSELCLSTRGGGLQAAPPSTWNTAQRFQNHLLQHPAFSPSSVPNDPLILPSGSKTKTQDRCTFYLKTKVSTPNAAGPGALPREGSEPPARRH